MSGRYTRYLTRGDSGAKLVLYGEFHGMPSAALNLRD